MDETEARPSIVGMTLLFVGAGLIVIAVGFLTFGFYSWVHGGIWPSYPASKMLAEIGIGAPHLAWGAGQRALDWLLSRSACTLLLPFGALVAALGGWLAVRHDRRRRLAQAPA